MQDNNKMILSKFDYSFNETSVMENWLTRCQNFIENGNDSTSIGFLTTDAAHIKSFSINPNDRLIDTFFLSQRNIRVPVQRFAHVMSSFLYDELTPHSPQRLNALPEWDAHTWNELLRVIFGDVFERHLRENFNETFSRVFPDIPPPDLNISISTARGSIRIFGDIEIDTQSILNIASRAIKSDLGVVSMAAVSIVSLLVSLSSCSIDASSNAASEFSKAPQSYGIKYSGPIPTIEEDEIVNQTYQIIESPGAQINIYKQPHMSKIEIKELIRSATKEEINRLITKGTNDDKLMPPKH